MNVTLAKHKQRHFEFWSVREYVNSTFFGFLLLILSMLINYVSTNISIRDVGNSTTDILLENLPIINTDIIFSQGVLVFILFIIILFLLEPKIIPFSLKSMALFITIRACFVVMTHLGPPAGYISTDLVRLGYVSSGADLFFSGHTGMPFMFALMFWKNENLRYAFLVCSVLAAFAVILGHLHYTIDVFSAYFITHGIYLISQKFFKKDFKLFESSKLI